MTDVVRWVFQDLTTNETHRVQLNPNEMSGYLFSKEFAFSQHGGGRVRAIKGRREPRDFTFSGVVRSQSHHNALINWERKPGKVRVTDHLGRAFDVMIESLEMIDRRPAGDDTWHFRYTFNCLLLRRVA